jgi:hypothetical protein
MQFVIGDEPRLCAVCDVLEPRKDKDGKRVAGVDFVSHELGTENSGTSLCLEEEVTSLQRCGDRDRNGKSFVSLH